MIKKCIAILLPVAIGGLTTSIQAATLEEIYQQALESDHTYKAAQANLDVGKESSKIGLAGLLPSVNATASYTEQTTDSSGKLDDGTDLDKSSVDGTTSGYQVTLRQPLFNMNSWYRYQNGRATSDIAEERFDIAEESLILRTATAYFDALQAVDNLSTAKAEENALSHQLEQTRQRFEVGLTAITEVHEAQAVFDSATAERLLAEGQLGISFEALEVLTGRPQSSLAPLKKDLPVASPVPAERTAWVEMALKNNNTLQVEKLNADAAKFNKKAATANHLPTVTFEAGYSDYTNEGYSQNFGQDGEFDTQEQTIGVVLSVPIFNGGGTSASRRQAAKQYIAAREVMSQTQRDVIQQTRSRHLTVLTNVATVKARSQAIVSNQSALEATQAGYDVGTRDLVDVLNAQRNLYRAQRDYYDALYSYVLSTLELKQAAGTLSSEDVAELNQWLDTSRNVTVSM
ncbi:TolC family outer membrane protein [Teredinibacter turnerae]|uniref:TolC family outer membrane protein n=1 Tax=Teredinibacter turnerae TaxID=2426 RepID=UPI000378A0F7|nr:TolC family outer membrane protein [Teredinibacter turnerae]